MATIIIDDDRRVGDEGFIEGCWGTVAEQLNEDFYDDRSDADDDMEKGRIKFPTSGKLYGREEELEKLRGLYGEIQLHDSPSDAGTARVVFVGGYSGVGKSAVISELVRQVEEEEHNRGDNNNIFCAQGKYSKLQAAAVPFSAIDESLGQLAAELTKPYYEELLEKIRHKLCCDDKSDIEQVMRITFPSVSPLFSTDDDDEKSNKGALSVSPNMNEVKQTFKDCLNCICSCLDSPLIWFLDDCQWSDEASFLLLNDVLPSKDFSNILFMGSYRSNEVNDEHPFHELMVNVEKSGVTTTVRVDLFGLSPDDIGEFISDTLGKDGASEVSTLTEAVYAKTLGNIFFVKQALEELVRKNALFYDVMMFTWEYNLTKVELENYLTDDVIKMVQSKIEGQPLEVKQLVVIMSFIPNNATLSTLIALLRSEGVTPFKVEKLMKYAVKQGMIIHQMKSDKYAFAHDKIREASFNVIPQGRPRDELLMRISMALIHLAYSEESEYEWAFFVAVDHMNSVSPELAPGIELSRLNFRVGEMNLAKGATFNANASFLAALARLNDSGSKWKEEYQFTLKLLNRVIVSEFSMGNFEMAFSYVEEVLENATSLKDKSTAYLYRMKTLAEGENRDYSIGVAEGLKICELYDVKFTNPPKKSDLIKESVQLKVALRNRPLTVLGDLPLAEDSSIFLLLKEVMDYAAISDNAGLFTVIADRSIQLALQKGRSKELMLILIIRATSLTRDLSKLKIAIKYASAAEILSEVFQKENKALCAEVRLRAMSVFSLHRPFRDCLGTMLDAYRPLKNAGNMRFALGAGMAYSYMYLNAGLPLNSPLIEPKLILFGEVANRVQMVTFEMFFSAYRQMIVNLRKQKKNWTTLKGDVFDEDAFLRSVEGNARAMSLRDTSTLRLILAFIFWEKECMVSMLDNLSNFADPDIIPARACLRLCFIGLAGFEMGRNKIANKCLDYFKSLSKFGSPNATPIYHFMNATASPSRARYDDVISLCKEARMVHLAAMANERCGMFLSHLGDDASKEYIVAAYWLYHDWGASSKTTNMLEQHSFLKDATLVYRKPASNASSDMRLANRIG